MFCMKKIQLPLHLFFLVFFPLFLFGNEKEPSPTTCKQKEETVKTIFELLPESERSCTEIAKLVLTEEDEEGEKLDKEYNHLFLKVCELKRKKRSLDDIKESLGLTKQCNSLPNLSKKN